MSRIAVIGAGPAGLTAGHRLRAAGHEVTVFEERDVPGGRTHSEHYGPGHWSDTGAGWLAAFYPRTLALFDELGERGRLRELKLRGGGDLLLDGRLVPNPNSITRIMTTPLLSPLAKVRFFGFMALLFATQRGKLRLDARYDDRTAEEALRLAGRDAAERIVRPSFEGPFFSRLEELSGALIRSWLRDLSIGTFYQVDGGMDAPWRALGESLAGPKRHHRRAGRDDRERRAGDARRGRRSRTLRRRRRRRPGAGGGPDRGRGRPPARRP